MQPTRLATELRLDMGAIGFLSQDQVQRPRHVLGREGGLSRVDLWVAEVTQVQKVLRRKNG